MQLECIFVFICRKIKNGYKHIGNMTYRTAMKVLENIYWLNYKVDTVSKAMKKVGVSVAMTERGHMIRHYSEMNKISGINKN